MTKGVAKKIEASDPLITEEVDEAYRQYYGEPVPPCYYRKYWGIYVETCNCLECKNKKEGKGE